MPVCDRNTVFCVPSKRVNQSAIGIAEPSEFRISFNFSIVLIPFYGGEKKCATPLSTLVRANWGYARCESRVKDTGKESVCTESLHVALRCVVELTYKE